MKLVVGHFRQPLQFTEQRTVQAINIRPPTFIFNFITGTCLVLKFEYVMRKAVIYPHIVLAVPFLALLA